MTNRAAISLIVLTTAVILWWHYRQTEVVPLPISPNIQTDSSPITALNIPLRGPLELNFLSKDDIFRMRKEWVASEPRLAPAGYEPLPEIFSAVGDGNPWWGLSGIYGLGPGEQSITGPAEESRILANPYLLVGLIETHAWKGMDPPNYNVAFYPTPIALVYRARNDAWARYNVSEHFSFLVQNNYFEGHKRELTFAAYNARDFGYNYLAVDAAKSRNVVWKNPSAGAARIQQMLHVGGSCGHPSGCTNMSPFQPELLIDIPELPANAFIRLWRSEPTDINAPPDMTFNLELL